MDLSISPLLEGDVARAVRCRLKAEEYRTLADQALTDNSRTVFLDLAGAADQMASEAQERIDADAARTPKPPSGN